MFSVEFSFFGLMQFFSMTLGKKPEDLSESFHSYVKSCTYYRDIDRSIKGNQLYEAIQVYTSIYTTSNQSFGKYL